MPVFKNIEAIKQDVIKKSEKGVRQAQNSVYKIIDQFLHEYYREYKPAIYERTHQLLNSLVKTEVIKTSNGFTSYVYFDVGALDYSVKYFSKYPVAGGYMNPFNGKVTPDGVFPNPKGSAELTLESAMHGSHGGYIEGIPIWERSIDILDQKGCEILKKKLIQAGIPLK